MNVDVKELFSLFFAAIFLGLILKNGSETNTILGTAGTQLNTLTKTLEGSS